MSAVFLKAVNLSITASWLILAVILVRFLLKKAPKWISCVLWALVAVRLVCPFSLESALSLIPKTEWISGEQAYGADYFTPNIDHIDVGTLSELYPDANVSISVQQPEITIKKSISMIGLLPYIWLAGTATFLLYALISYIRLKKNVRASVPVRDNILACDEVKSPFILGIMKPLIYVPSSMEGETLDYVITHESAHIQRRDYWWKPFGFLLLAVYWFNPLCWLAYILLCRDIEMACDEKVIRNMDKGSVAAYSQALLDCSFPRRRIAACPLAFGEVGVKERVTTVLNYKKPAFWIIATAVVACIVVGVCFMTNPKTTFKLEKLEIAHYWFSDVPQKAEVTVTDPQTLSTFSELLNYGGRNWSDDITKLEPEEYFVLELNDDLKLHIDLLREDAWYMDEVKNGQFIREASVEIEVVDALMEMLSENSRYAEKWFDCLHGDEMNWDGMREINIDEFPGVTFRAYSERIEAVTDKETVTLYTGMPIWSVYFCDMNGDGKLEICSSISLGSGIIDNRIIVADYANNAVYELSDRGYYDYSLTCQDGQLRVEKRAYMQDAVLEAGSLVLQSVIGTDGTAIPMLMIGQSEYQNDADISKVGGVDGPDAVDIAVDNKTSGTYYSLTDQGKLKVSGSIDSNHSYVQSQMLWTNSTKISIKNNSDTDVTAYLFSTENDSTPILEMTLSNKGKKTFTNLSSRYVYYVRISADSSVNVDIDISDGK